MITARADVSTDKPDRYVKQLASHLGRRCLISEEGAHTRITLDPEVGSGSCLLKSESGVLVLEAEAEDAEALDKLNDVVGRHLERFGQRDGLSVSWIY